MAPEELFHLDFVTDASVPDVPAACHVNQPTYLLRPHRLMYFGHMLRDNFHHVATNLQALGRHDIKHGLLIWRTRLDEDSSELHVPSKYLNWIADNLRTWEDVVSKCATAPAGAPALHDSHHDSASMSVLQSSCVSRSHQSTHGSWLR